MVDTPKIDTRILEEQLAKAKAANEWAAHGAAAEGMQLAGGNGGRYIPDMGERLAKLEGAFEGLKSAIEGLRHSQNMMLGATLAGFGLLIAIGLYTLNRIDLLPGEFQAINRTLSEAISAAKQTPPQVILIPAPAPQQPTITPAPQPKSKP